MQPCGSVETNSKFGMSVDAWVPAVIVMAAVFNNRTWTNLSKLGIEHALQFSGYVCIWACTICFKLGDAIILNPSLFLSLLSQLTDSHVLYWKVIVDD